MSDHAAPPEIAQLASALAQIGRARTRELWLRSSLWAWAIFTLVWLLPVGPWSPTELPLPVAVGVSVALALCGAILGLLHRRASRIDAVRTAMAQDDGTDGDAERPA